MFIQILLVLYCLSFDSSKILEGFRVLKGSASEHWQFIALFVRLDPRLPRGKDEPCYFL